MLSLPLDAPPGEPLSVLAIGAHPDDIEIGAGGLLLGLAGTPLRTRYVVLTGTAERHQEAREAARSFLPDTDLTLDLFDLPEGRLPAVWDRAKEILEEVARSARRTSSSRRRSDDAHQDHRVIGEIVPTVFRDQLYLAYEIPKWDGDIGRPSMYVPLPAHVMQLKVELLHKCFPSQRGRDWWDDEVFLGTGAAARHGVPGALRRGVHVHQISDRARGVRAGQRAGEGSVMNIVIDPDVPSDELRRTLYAGHLVILTRLQALRDFVEYTREELTELFTAPRPGTRARAHRAGRDGEDPQRLEAPLHPLGQVQEARPGGDRGGGLLTPRRPTTTCRSRGRPSRSGISTPGWPSPSRGTATPGTARPPSRSTGGFPSSRCATTTP